MSLGAGIKVESEIKIVCRENPLPRCPRLSLTLIHPRHFEDNWLWDFEDRRLASTGRILRLRQVDGAAWLTHKSASHDHSLLKVREEIEVSLDDAEAMASLLKAVGFVPVFRYQKFRTAYQLRLSTDEVLEAMFDETPMGNFLELEGDAAAITQAIAELGVPREALSNKGYPALWIEYLQAGGEPSRDMVFSPNEAGEGLGDQCEG